MAQTANPNEALINTTHSGEDQTPTAPGNQRAAPGMGGTDKAVFASGPVFPSRGEGNGHKEDSLRTRAPGR